MRLLLVEDDKELGQLIRDELLQQGYSIHWSERISDARLQLEKAAFDVAVLDLYLPDGKGFDLVSAISSPVIMMSALGSPENRLKGAELGVVEFIPKPFLLKELLIKIERVLGQKVENNKVWQFNNVTLDLGKRRIVAGGDTHLLNKRDFRLLEILTLKYPEVVSRDVIIDHVYGKQANPSHRTIDNSVVRLRQMLNDENHEWIRSVRGEGYQWQRERLINE